jgi:2'-5' RNA ligase
LNKLRVFLAINLPKDVRTRLVAVQAELARTLPEKAIRWTAPEQLHLTLKFLGHLPEETVSRISAEAQPVCARSSTFHLTARSVGFFPGANRPRIVWVGIQGASLAQLQAELEQACCAITSQPPENRFKGHVTLGRIKSLTRAEGRELAKAAESDKTSEFGGWTVRTVELMQSHLSPQGSVYSVLKAFPLHPPKH